MNIPKHIAIIMDGNGRWAKKRRLPRVKGHQNGINAVRTTVKHCAKLGVKTLTLFAFSSENKNRSGEEVSLLFKLFLTVLKQEVKKLKKHNVKLKIIGDMELFPKEIQKSATDAQNLLKNNTGLTLVVCANYGGQWDIAQACQKITQKALQGRVQADSIDVKTLSRHMSLAEEGSVDLLIRTSGEQRISNFLLWEIAYSELYFTKTLWPDFDTNALDLAIENFNRRDRRFGLRKEDKAC